MLPFKEFIDSSRVGRREWIRHKKVLVLQYKGKDVVRFAIMDYQMDIEFIEIYGILIGDV